MICTTNGDGGDAIYSMAILQAMPGGPHTYLVEEKDDLTATGKNDGAAQKLYEFLRPLVELQPYIHRFSMAQSTDAINWRSGGFRKAGLHRRTEPLMQAHLNHLNQVTGMGLKVNTSEPWLHHVDPDERSANRVVVNRTARYRNKHFPWAKVVEFYRGHLIFVGLPHEHAEFCNTFGPVDFIPTSNALELAQVIAGSFLFIGNQSCANAICEGMKHHSIQETSLFIPDCVFKRDNAQHVWNGDCILPSLEEGDGMHIMGHDLSIGLVSTMRTPPLGWQFPGIAPIEQFDMAVDLVMGLPSHRGATRASVIDAIKMHNLYRCPDFFRPPREGENVKQAMRHAGYPI